MFFKKNEGYKPKTELGERIYKALGNGLMRTEEARAPTEEREGLAQMADELASDLQKEQLKEIMYTVEELIQTIKINKTIPQDQRAYTLSMLINKVRTTVTNNGKNPYPYLLNGAEILTKNLEEGNKPWDPTDNSFRTAYSQWENNQGPKAA